MCVCWHIDKVQNFRNIYLIPVGLTKLSWSVFPLIVVLTLILVRSFVSLQTVFWNSCFARFPPSFVLWSSKTCGVSSQSDLFRGRAFPNGSQSSVWSASYFSLLWASFIFQHYTDSLTIDPSNRVQIPRCFMLWAHPSCLSQLETGLVQHCVLFWCQGTNRELVLFVMMTPLVFRSTGKVIIAIAVQH